MGKNTEITKRNMEIKDYISIIALLISVFTFYRNVLRGPRYVSPPMRWLALGFIPGSTTLVVNFPIAITNIGSQTGVVDSFYIELINLISKKTEKFYAWQEGILTDPNFKGFGLEMPTPVALKAGEGAVKHYIFSPDSLEFMYVPGTYKIIVYAYLDNKKRPIKLSQQELEIVDILEPSPIPNTIALLFSYNLFPKKVLKISSYGTKTSSVSLIEVVRR